MTSFIPISRLQMSECMTTIIAIPAPPQQGMVLRIMRGRGSILLVVILGVWWLCAAATKCSMVESYCS